MKLLFCRKCRGTFGLQSEHRTCPCGCCFGRYFNDPFAVWGEKEKGMGIPFAVDNNSFFARYDKDGNFKKHNEIYDQWYGQGKICCWIFKNKKSMNFDQMTKVSEAEYETWI